MASLQAPLPKRNVDLDFLIRPVPLRWIELRTVSHIGLMLFTPSIEADYPTVVVDASSNASIQCNFHFGNRRTSVKL